ncbi:hypothetical protein CJBVI_1792 [Corynebacterium jeikeium]|nr:hypothetical protein CJBVI_1792 [Corynebacterium jeikeium]
MKRNGTTRWRCKQCGASSVKRRNDITNAAVFTQFIEHCTTAISLDDLAVMSRDVVLAPARNDTVPIQEVSVQTACH